MPKRAKNELTPIIQGFNYSVLDAEIASTVRGTAERIKERLKRTLEDVIQVGADLLKAKSVLEHGQFGAWLRGEFGWSERTAQNLMSVAEQFGPRSEIIADLAIQPTAAYLLAAPSVPEEARRAAIERAESGEKITATVAKELVAKAKKKIRVKRMVLSRSRLSDQLKKALKRFRDRWDPERLGELAQGLREFAAELDKIQRSSR